MKQTISISFAILTLFIVIVGNAQIEKLNGQKSLSQYSHEVWTTDDGLPQNSINNLVQTPDGYLWMGTQEGLARFDGVQFTVFDKHNTPQIKNNYISALYADREGTLWIGTYDGGLITYKNNKFVGIKTIKLLENSYSHSIFEDNARGIWIAIRGRGVMRIDSVSHQTFDTSNGLVHNQARNFCQDSKGRVWIATKNGISIYDKGTFRSFTMNDGLIYSVVNSITKGLNNTMWLATNRGVQKVPEDFTDSKKFETYGVKDGLPDNIAYEIKLGTDGTLWIGTRGGVAQLSNGKISSFTVADGLSYHDVGTILIDFEENVWIGTDGGGLNVLKDGIVTSFTKKEGMPSNTIWTIFEDPAQTMWIGTDNGLVNMSGTDKRSYKYFTEREGIYDNEIYSITMDNTGAMWIGTINGVNKIVNGKVETIKSSIKTKGVIVSQVFEDSRNRIWIATSGEGLHMIDNSLVRTYSLANGFISNYIGCIAEDTSGNILVGTDGEGLVIVSEKQQTIISKKDGLSNNFILSLNIDQEGVVWAGTSGGGLNRIANGVITSVTVKEGLYDDLIFQILEDNFGRMWMTSNRGIFHVNKSELTAFAEGKIRSINSVAYGKEDGLRSLECNGGVQPAGWKARDGTLWFPTNGGVAMIDPKKIVVNHQPPRVILEEMRVENQVWKESFVLPGKERFEFRFTGINFAAPKKICFKVKLEGYDKEWYDIGARRAAYYTQLPPGEYTFRVIAGNSDGVWNESGASFSFVVQAHFYKTTIFYITLISLLVIGTIGMVRLRIRQINSRQRELERIVEERTKNLVDANNAKSQLLSFVAHDLKTPLITIYSIAQEIKAFNNIDRHFRGYIDLVEQNSKRVVKLISEILNISAIESGKFQFKFEPINIAEMAGIVVDGYRVHALRKEQKLIFTVESDEQCIVMADSVKLPEAMENLVNNAIKYSPRHSQIAVTVALRGENVLFTVQDQGPGISAEDQQQLFKKFHVLSAKPTGGEIATGLGLAIVKEIVEAHHGSVYVKSTPPMGSLFTIEMKKVEK